MIMTDPIADMLTRVRNAQRAGHRRVDIPLSKEKAAIARKLAETHFIENYKVLEANGTAVLRVYLKYTPDGRPVIRGMRRVSKPGHRTYVKVKEIPLVRGGLGVAILSTSRGILTDHEARAAGVGGELVAIVH